MPSVGGQLLSLTAQVSAYGRPVEAVAPAEAAVDVLRGVASAADATAAHRSLFAVSLHTLALRLFEAQRVSEAVGPAQEAVMAYRHAAAAADADVPSVGGQLLSLTAQVSAYGRPVEAVAPARLRSTCSAAWRRRRMRTAAHRSLFAVSLHTLALRLFEAQRVSEAVGPAQEAVMAYRHAAAAADADVPSVGGQLLSLTAQVSAYGRPVEAVAPAEAAVDVLRGVASAADATTAHRSLFAVSLHTLALRLFEAQRVSEALVPAQEAVAAYRPLAAGDPSAFQSQLEAVERLVASLES